MSYAKIVIEKNLCLFPAFPPFLEETLADLKTLAPDTVFTDSAKDIVAEGQKMVQNYKDKVVRPGFQFKTKPYAHQVESMLYAAYHPRNALVLSCGVGKSKIAIDTINFLDKKALILAPGGLVTNWRDEFATHSSKDYKIVLLNDASVKKKRKKIENLGDADVVVVGYDTAANYQEEILNAFKYDILVADELHKLKNPKSRRTKAALAFSQQAHYRTGLSGTMVLNSPLDLYSQLEFLSPQIINLPYYIFSKRFVTYAEHNSKIAIGVKNLDVLNKTVRKFTIRYTKEECLDLPDRTVIKRFVALSDEQIQMNEDILSDDDLYLDEGTVSKLHKVAALNKLHQVTAGFMYVSQKDPEICNGCHNLANCVENQIKPYTKVCAVVQKAPPNNVIRFKRNPKMDMLVELLDSILVDEDNKVIIWAQHVEEIKMITEKLRELKIGHVVLENNPAEDVKSFNSDPSIKVVVGNISKGVGFTANAANYTIYYALTFSLEAYLQSIDRNYRIGQLRKVIVYMLLAENTVDARVVQAIDNKQDIMESLLNNMQCNRCALYSQCLPKGITQYGKGCKYMKSVITANS